MDRKAFFAALRRRESGVFGTSLKQRQVDGLERLLNVWSQYYAKGGSAQELAYNLGTSYHETAHTMQPIKERGSRSYFNKYEPGTKLGKVLGNTKPGDGYRFRGEGDVQNTGRANARKSSKRISEVFGLKVDFEANPSLRGDPIWSAHCLFLGNREGWWTGKDIDDFIDGVDEDDAEDLREYRNARRIVNGTDKASTIAGYALAFEKALKSAGYNGKPVDRDKLDINPKPTQKPTGTVQQPVKRSPMAELFAGFLELLKSILRGGK